MTHIEWHTSPTPDQAADALALQVASVLHDAISKHGNATLVVSGGRTPVPFFLSLNALDLPWDRIALTLADERFVSPSHPESNEALVRQYLLHDGSDFIALYHAGLSLASCAKKTSDALANVRFDAVVLGMGEDGHTASLFPNHESLPFAFAPDAPACLPVSNAPKPPPQRLTLSAPRLMDCGALFVLIAGAAKREILTLAAQQNNPADYPIAAFLHHPNVQVFWSEK